MKMKIIIIGAIWCPGCLMMRKVWKNIMKDYDNIEVIEFDYDIDKEKFLDYNIGNAIPVTIFLSKDGVELSRYVGELKEDKIRSEIDKYV